jgi:anaerobic magnesium-protoporphyrin IX monomethyl ester cyclase
MITFINAPGLKSFSGLQMHTPNPPIGLAYIAAVAREAGYDVAMVDGAGEALDDISVYPGRTDFKIQGLSLEAIVERVPEETTVLCVSCMFSSQWPLTSIMVDKLREAFPDVLIIGGGEHATAVPEYVCRNSNIDVLVIGEGEDTLLALLQAGTDRSAWRDVTGLAYLDGEEYVDTGLSVRRRSLDELPWPAWDLLPMEDYIVRHQSNGVNMGRSMQIISTRGCPYRCTFCSNEQMWTTRYVTRDPKLVVDEMESYMATYNVTNFDFQDLTAIVNRKWAIRFCNEIIDRGLKITWQMPSGTRSEVFDEEVAGLLYKSGCRALAFAPESGAPEILEAIKKKVDLEKLVTSAKIAMKHNMKVSCFFVIGFPDDTPETLRKSLKMIRRLAVIGLWDVAVTKFVPYPGSSLFHELQKSGKISLDDDFFHSPMDFYIKDADSYCNAMSSRELYWWMVYMFYNFYLISFALHPIRTFRMLIKGIMTGQEETRYVKWFVDRIFTRKRWKKLEKAQL